MGGRRAMTYAPSTERKGNPYSLKKPCARCPFRSDIDFPLMPGRAKEFADQIRGGWEFPCHKTTVDYEDDGGNSGKDIGPNTKACAGALLVQRNEGSANQMVRIAERLGMLNLDDLVDTPVFESLSAFVKARGGDSTTPTVVDPHSGEVLEFEHCGVVGEDCEDPAGYAMNGGVSENDDPPTCNPLTDSCGACGSLMCHACRATPSTDKADGLCIYCAEDDDGPD